MQQQQQFELFITSVDKVGPMLKLWGQTDRVTSMFVEHLLRTTSEQFERESNTVNLSHLTVGLLCCAKYKDGLYYRGEITSVRSLISGLVEVKFIDFGNIEMIRIENIRLLRNVPVGLSSVKPQALDFILAGVMYVNRVWDEKVLTYLHQEIAYMELRSMVVSVKNEFRLIKIVFHDTDLSEYLVQKGLAVPVSITTQEMILCEQTQIPGPQYGLSGIQPVPIPVPAPVVPPPVPAPNPMQFTSPPAASQELCSYKTIPLPPGTEHMVYVSYVEDGPYLFTIQLQQLESQLEKLMIELNQLPLLPLTETPIPGYPCMARCLEDNSVCRAVVMNLVGDKCKTYFVDFGNTDVLPFANIYQIPFKYILPKVMAMRFTLAGLKNVNVTNEMKFAFKEFVTNKLLKLKVLKLEGSVLQYCELYDADTNVINILYETANEYKTIPLSKGMKYNVIVSYIEGCKQFFVQLKECTDPLNNLMLSLANECKTTSPLRELKAGAPCVAFYLEDSQWYRAEIMTIHDNKTVTVRYIDYGNESTVTHDQIQKIEVNFVKMLPAQAIQCCLCGYQNMKFNDEIEEIFETLTLGNEFSMKVISKQDDNTVLVDLFDTCGNNLAALLIEKLAVQKSQVSPMMPSHSITKTILNENESSVVSADGGKKEEKEENTWRSSPSQEKPWRNADNDRKSWRNASNENKAWKSNDSQNSETWNGNSPNSKKSFPRTDSFERNNTFNKRNNRSDRFTDKGERSPKSDFGKSNNTGWPSGSDSEKSWSGGAGGNKSGKHFENKKSFNKFDSNPAPKIELAPQDLAPFNEPFQYQELLGCEDDVSISWFYDPEHFYCQIVSKQKEFRDMMNEIQSAYNGRAGVGGIVPIGSSVIAEFKDDGVLYRATVLEEQQSNYKVKYVDFGNVSLVDSQKIWRVEKKFMTIPVQAVKCGLVNLKSTSPDSKWPVSSDIDNIFNRESFTFTFDFVCDDKFVGELFTDDVNVRKALIDLGFGVDSSVSESVDDPIDLNILTEQNIKIHVSHIDGLDKFYVHIEKEKVNELLESMNSIDINTLQKFPSESIVPGGTCLVKMDDNWRRGVISDNSDMNAIVVQYPDFGGSEQVTSDKLFNLPEQLYAFWYQAFECTLHNLSADVQKLISDEEFKSQYEGSDLIIYVCKALNERLFVNLFDLTGTKLNLIDLDENSVPTAEPVCPLPAPILRKTLSVWISQINDDGTFYLQRSDDSDSVATLLEKLFEHYDPIEEVIDAVTVGDLCCAKSNDGNWYRSRIVNIEDDNVTVLYIDYGNNEIVDKNQLRKLDPLFYEPHECSFKAFLNVENVNDGFVEKFTELTFEKSLKANFIDFVETKWIVELCDGNSNLNQILIDNGFVVPFSDQTETEPELKLESKSNDIQSLITITHIDSPSEFYVQLISNGELIDQLQSNLQEIISELPDLETPDVGLLCAAKYSVDEQWYRAEVLDADADITTVRFIDYGNTDVITNNTGAIKTLPSDLISVDKYARKCSLNLVPSKGEEWTQEACEIFENTVNVDQLRADIIYQDEKNKTFVDLFLDGVNIADALLKSELAVPILRDVEMNLANNTGFVSHLNSITEFWIQLESSVPDLEMIVDRLTTADSFPDLQDLSPGILCAANFPDDEMWYRARILSNTVAGVEVLFIDYGNSSTAMKLKSLPEDLVQMPALAQKCSLCKPSDVNIWSDEATEKFREISADGVTIFTVKKLTPGETSVVELFVDGNDIVDQLVGLCSGTESEPKSAIVEPKQVNVHVTHIENPDYFWAQITSDSNQIDEIMKKLSTAQDFPALTDWNEDTTCAALYTDSGLWYRAKIIQFSEQYEVLLLDYGNFLKTDYVRTLPSELETIQPLVTLCSLQLPEGVTEWSTQSETKFVKMLDGLTDCYMEFLNKDEIPCKVNLFLNGRSVAEEICSSDDTSQEITNDLTSENICLIAINTKLPEGMLETENLDEEAEISETKSDENEVFETKSDEEEVIETKLDEEKVTETKSNEKEVTEIKSDEKEVTETKIKECDKIMHKEENDSESRNKTETDSEKLDVENPTPPSDKTLIEILFTENADINRTRTSDIGMDDFKHVMKKLTFDDASEKIVPGSISRGDLESVSSAEDLSKQEPSSEKEEIVTPVIVPYYEKLVPGSISRGDLESVDDEDFSRREPSTSGRSAIPYSEKLVPGSISRGDLESVSSADEFDSDLFERSNTDRMETPRRVIIPYSEKLVPGSISRGDLESVDDVDDSNKLKSTSPIFLDCESNVDLEEKYVIPYSEKLVPGSISRGDLELVSSDDGEDFNKDLLSPVFVDCEDVSDTSRNGFSGEEQDKNITIERNRAVIPHCEKLVPGSISRGDLGENI